MHNCASAREKIARGDTRAAFDEWPSSSLPPSRVKISRIEKRDSFVQLLAAARGGILRNVSRAVFVSHFDHSLMYTFQSASRTEFSLKNYCDSLIDLEQLKRMEKVR